ncbi:hypothetical protein V6Z11_A09G048700 [Gossypium hirsutum]
MFGLSSITVQPLPTPRLKDDAFGSPSNFDLNKVNRDQRLNYKVWRNGRTEETCEGGCARSHS